MIAHSATAVRPPSVPTASATSPSWPPIPSWPDAGGLSDVLDKMATAPDARIESNLGPYRLVRCLGRGGMGVVYEAIHIELGQRIAVKFLSDAAAHQPAYFQRFATEARAASAVSHPGLVKVFGAGRDVVGTPYLLMELLEGEVLRVRMDRLRQLRLDMAVRIVRQTAAALAAVHAAGIVHRDVKPENLILVADDVAEGGERCKLLDFGIARFSAGGSQPGSATPGLLLTEPGAVVGTPAYMAPEQRRGDTVGPAADVHALGVMAHEMLSGQRPGDGKPLEVIGLPAHILDLIERMQAPNPAHRPTAATVAGLMHVSGSTPPIVVPAPPVGWAIGSSDGTEGGVADLGAAAGGAMTPQLTPANPRNTPREAFATTRAQGRDRGDADDGASTVRDRVPAWSRLAIAAQLLVVVVAVLLLSPMVQRAPAPGPAGAEPVSLPVPLAGMVYFPGGTFTMGRSAVELDAECKVLGARCIRATLDREQPARQVTLSPFYLDVDEVTNAELANWLGGMPMKMPVDRHPATGEPIGVRDGATGRLLLDLDSDHSALITNDGRNFSVRPGDERRPAVMLTWDAADAFCRWRGKRLPTEAEWEFAARGTTARRFPWGDSEPTCDRAVFGGGELGLCPGRERVEDVDASSGDWTPEGIHGMAGNASEWVADAFTLPYLPDCGRCIDPVVRTVGGDREDLRVFRGAAFNTSLFLRTSARGRWGRNLAGIGLGFRCAVSGAR